ncbi:HAD domain-containing protein [Pedobacter sp. MC2016-15]|uniref:HAD domain-containing protein n=1 Tax=Pedobacter sp. MC2016-15 TaxID=2994473 RepID=UPI0022486EFF|nr:HAD domain-containing protein [Pedobacter sp. MC2016-15]MCX2480668.1 HAD domain-containing protein [Pedobacter sp. MC2016-15]
MNVLLDIDGVMVPVQSWKKPEFLRDGFPVFSPKSIQALQKIIDHTHASIILTTSHKASYSIAEWKDIFIRRGIVIADIDRLPKNEQNLSRKDEILSWYTSTDHSDENLVIIDDDKSLNALPQELKKNLVMTSSMIGLTDELAEEAISILEAGVLIPA